MKHEFKRGDEIIWRPGNTQKTFEAIYVSGNPNIRAHSTIFVVELEKYRRVYNNRLDVKPKLVEPTEAEKLKELQEKYDALSKRFRGLLHCKPDDLKRRVRQAIFKMGL